MKFKDLVEGNIYTDKNNVNAYMFVEMRNDYIATFKRCEYDEEQGNYISTEEDIYLVESEVKRLISL